MKQLLVVLAVLTVLAGCSNDSSALRYANAAKAHEADRTNCLAYGFKEGTDNFAICMLEMDKLRREDNAEARQRFANAMIAMGRALNPPRVTCNTTGTAYGSGNFASGQSSTTCY